MGTLVAFLVRHKDRLALLNRSWFPNVLFWGGTLVVGVLLIPRPLLATVGWFNVTALFSLLALGFGAILLALVLNQKLYGRLFESRFLFFFSKISYSLYPAHMVFLGITLKMVDAVLDPWTVPPAVRFLVYVPLFLVLSVTWSLALHYVVEKPVLLLKDRI